MGAICNAESADLELAFSFLLFRGRSAENFFRVNRALVGPELSIS
jgi:hypothetical protein